MFKVKITLVRVRDSGETKEELEFFKNYPLTLSYLQTRLEFYSACNTLFFIPAASSNLPIEETRWRKGAKYWPKEISTLILRPFVPKSASPNQPTLRDIEEEGVNMDRVPYLRKDMTLRDPVLDVLVQMLLTPVALPIDPRFKDMMFQTNCFLLDGTIPGADRDAVTKLLLADKNYILDMEGDQTEYYKYFILLEKTSHKMRRFFFHENAPRTADQWRSVVYQPLFEATSLSGIVTGPSPLTIHKSIADTAFFTTKMSNCARGTSALEPDLADGFFAVAKDTCAYGDDCMSVKFSEKPFSQYKEAGEVQLGVTSHLLLDTVVEFKEDDEDAKQVLAKLIGEQTIISLVLQRVTEMNNLTTFGYLIDKESVDLYVMQPLQNQTNHVTATNEKREPRLQSTKLFHWDLKDDTKFFEFSIFLWRVRALRRYQSDLFLDAYYQNNKKLDAPSQDSAVDSKRIFSAEGGELKMLHCINKGASAKVFLAILNKRRLAVKQFSENSLDLLQNELAIYKKLKGLSCVPEEIPIPLENSLGLEHFYGVHYFIAENLKDVLQYMTLLLKALCDIRSRRIIHSDVKFSNVIYDSKTNTLKLIDFAYSVIAEHDNKLQYCEGSTTAYAAPEVRNSTQVGFASDVYSAGMMFVSLLYGVQIINTKDYKLFEQLVSRVENKFKCPEATFIAQQMIAKDWVQRISAKEAMDQILRIQPDLVS